jgi:thiol-disulfide isomerase/thioredoxin
MTKVLGAIAICAALLAQDKPEVGKVVGDLSMKSLDGKELKLSQFRADKEKKQDGTITVLYFWSYKCPSGKPVIAKAAEFAKKHAGDKSGVTFLCVAAYGESADDLSKYVKDNDIKETICHDDGKVIARALGTKQVNTTYVMDKEGKLFYRGGFDNAADAVTALKEGKAAPESDKKFQG